MKRRTSRPVPVGDVVIGGGAPIVVQSMTNTDTADVEATAQPGGGARARGLRARAHHRQHARGGRRRWRSIRERLDARGCDVPLVGDFHYNGHKLLTAVPRLRPRPCQVPHQSRQRRQGREARRAVRHDDRVRAARYGKPVRIGVNWGSLDAELLARLMDENARLAEPQDAAEVMREAVIRSALDSARQAERWGLAPERIVLSCKMSQVQDLIAVYREPRRALRLRAAPRAHRSRHGLEGHRRLHRGDGGAAAGRHRRHDSRLAHARARRRARRARCMVAQEILQTHGPACLHADGQRLPRLRPHHQHRSSRSSRRSIEGYLRSQMPVWKARYPGVEKMHVAVMGCVVNGPGESQARRTSASACRAPGEVPVAPVYVDGRKTVTLKGERHRRGVPGDRRRVREEPLPARRRERAQANRHQGALRRRPWKR